MLFFVNAVVVATMNLYFIISYFESNFFIQNVIGMFNTAYFEEFLLFSFTLFSIIFYFNSFSSRLWPSMSYWRHFCILDMITRYKCTVHPDGSVIASLYMFDSV